LNEKDEKEKLLLPSLPVERHFSRLSLFLSLSLSLSLNLSISLTHQVEHTAHPNLYPLTKTKILS